MPADDAADMSTARQETAAAVVVVPILLTVWAEGRGTGEAWGFAASAAAVLVAYLLSRGTRAHGELAARSAIIIVASLLALSAWYLIIRPWASLPGATIVESARWASIAALGIAAHRVASMGTLARTIVSWAPAMVVLALAAHAGVPAIVDGLPDRREGGWLDDSASAAAIGGIAMAIAALAATSTRTIIRMACGPAALVAGLAIAVSGAGEAFAMGVLALAWGLWGRARRLQDALAVTLAVGGAMLGAGVVPDRGWVFAGLIAGALGAAAALGPRATSRREGEGTQAATRRGQGMNRIALAGLVGALAISLLVVVMARDDIERPDAAGGADRSRVWATSLDIWSEAPVIGHGADAFRARANAMTRSLDAPDDAHSVVLRLATDGGAVAVALALAALGGALMRMRAARRTIHGVVAWRGAAVARAVFAGILLQSLVWRTVDEPVLVLCMAAAAGAAACPAPVPTAVGEGHIGGRFGIVLFAAVTAALLALPPVVALGLREHASSGDGAAQRRSARFALRLEPGAASVRALRRPFQAQPRGARRALEPLVDEGLRNDRPALVAVSRIADDLRDDRLAELAERQLRESSERG